MTPAETRTDCLKTLPVARRWQRQSHPAVSVVALVPRIAGGVEEYVLIRRKREPYAGCWALPGGKWEFGESLAAAVAREVKEETGLEAAFSELRAVVDCHLLPRGRGHRGAHFLLFVCAFAEPTGEARDRGEGAVSWFSAMQLATLRERRLLPPSDHLILERYRNPASGIAYVEAVIRARGRGAAADILRFHQSDGRAARPRS